VNMCTTEFAACSFGIAPNNTVSATAPTANSPARKACEQNAQNQLNTTMASLNTNFFPNMLSGAQEGGLTGLVGGCIAGASAGGVGCLPGALDGLVLGGVMGAAGSAGHTVVNGLQARNQYAQAMAACAQIP
jgi:hypothetical protein